MPAHYRPGRCRKQDFWCWLIVAIALNAGGATPYLAPDSVMGSPGQTVSIPLRLNGTSGAAEGFNATVYLPAESTLIGVTRGSLLPSSNFVLVAQALGDPAVNAVAIYGYSLAQTITSTGVLCSLQVDISSAAGPGDYPVVLNAPDRSPVVRNSHALSGANGSSSVAHTAGDAVLSVRIPGVSGDSNGNGIPDIWEISKFGVITNVNDRTDFDHDGLSDYLEYRAGTEPTDPSSCLAIMAPAVQYPSDGCVELKWYSISGATYRVERAQSLSESDGFSRVGLDVSASPPLNCYTDHPPAGVQSSFYRVLLLAP